MKLTIIRDDNKVYINNESLVVNCSSLPTEIRAVQWNNGSGWIEYDSNDVIRPNENIDNIDQFQFLIDAWNVKKQEIIAAEQAKANAVPQVVTAFQARAALYSTGLLATVENAVASSNNEILKIAWEYALTVRRESPFIDELKTEINLTDSDIDNLFRIAANVS
jgi:hypothetical protein